MRRRRHTYTRQEDDRVACPVHQRLDEFGFCISHPSAWGESKTATTPSETDDAQINFNFYVLHIKRARGRTESIYSYHIPANAFSTWGSVLFLRGGPRECSCSPQDVEMVLCTCWIQNLVLSFAPCLCPMALRSSFRRVDVTCWSHSMEVGMEVGMGWGWGWG